MRGQVAELRRQGAQAVVREAELLQEREAPERAGDSPDVVVLQLQHLVPP